MSIKYFKSSLLILVIFSLQFFNYAQEKKNKILDDYLYQYLINKNIPSISSGILDNGEIVWLNGIGKADLEFNIDINKNSLYRIASISKPITAVAILQLWEQGLLNLDTDVRKYIPSFPAKRYKFTIRQLLNHTSGIRNYKEGEFDSKKFFASTDEALKIFAYDSLIFEPGTKYEYTSLGYTLLAAVIETITSTSFENYVKNNIFLPAGMKSSRVDKQKEIIFNRVCGYEKNLVKHFINAPLADLSIKVAGGGFLSTSEELLLFAKALLGNKLIKKTTLEMMLQKSKLNNGKEIGYGLGFSVEFENDTLKYFSHNGAGTGFSSALVVDYQKKFASVYLINIRDRNLGNPAKDVLHLYEGKTFVLPTKTLSEELMNNYMSSGIDSTIKKFNDILSNQKELFNLNENEVQYFGFDLIELDKTFDAILYLKEALKIYPKSFIITATIADAYLKDKNEGLALRYYRTAAQINSSNQRVNNLIKKLSSKK